MSASDRPILFIALMAALTSLGPLAMQIFLPALPAIQAAFAVAPGTAQLVLSASMVTIALSTLAYGPLSDTFGRRPVLFAGLTLFIAGSVVAAAAPSIWVLIGGRVLQSVGGAAGMVVTRAIIRDRFERERAAQIMAYTITAFVTVPMIAPVIGGFLIDFVGWRSVFVFAAGAGIVVALVALPQVPETLREPLPRQGLRAMAATYTNLLRNAAFAGYALMLTFSISTFFGFAGAAPYVMVTVLGRAPSSVGIYLALTTAGFMAGTLLTARVTPRIGLERMMVVGCALSFVSALVGVVVVLALPWTPWLIFGPAIAVAFANGLIVPNGQAAVVSVDPAVAGSAAGLTSFMQWTTGALFAQAAGMMQFGTPLPMVLLIAIAAGLSLAAITLLPRWAPRER